MNNKLKIVLSSCYGGFEPNKKYQEILDNKGLNWWEMEARIDSDIIDFIEKNQIDNYKVAQVGRENYQYVSIEEVDITKPWTIQDYDGSEYIQYIEYEVLDDVLNYCKLL